MDLRIAGMLIVLAPSTLMACESKEQLVFACPTDNGRYVEICQGSASIQYTFGKPGQKPELKLSERNADFVWEHGESVSAGIADDLVFNNGTTRYFISHVSNFDDRSEFSAHLTVIQPGRENRYIDCAAGKAKFYPEAIQAEQREMSEGVPTF